jgi:predicted nucleotidyltransferase
VVYGRCLMVTFEDMLTQRQTSSLDRLVQSIVDKAAPLRIILFGSAARGEQAGDSDIDLLVVVPDGTHRRKTAQGLYRETAGIGVPFDLVVATRSDLEQHADNRGLIFRSALREGRELYVA